MKYSSAGDGSEIHGTVLVLAKRLAQSVFRNTASNEPNCIENPVWGCVFLFYAILARGLGLDALTYPEAVFGSSLAVFRKTL